MPDLTFARVARIIEAGPANGYGDTYDDMARAVLALLKSYLRHRRDCTVSPEHPTSCVCGYAALIKEIEDHASA